MVLGHALSPAGAAVTRTKGSAFSASTFDVSLGPSRAGLAAKIKRAQGVAPADEDGPDPFLAAAPPPALAALDRTAPSAFARAAALDAAPGPRPFDARAPPRA